MKHQIRIDPRGLRVRRAWVGRVVDTVVAIVIGVALGALAAGGF